MKVVWSSFNMWFTANYSMHVHQTLFVKCSCKQSCGAKNIPCQLFVHPLSFDNGTTDNTSQLFEYIKDCFHVNDLILLPESKGWLLVNPPPPPHTHTPFPLLLHNGFTRRWPRGNEVWSFCDATGKLPCGTVLSILVHLLQFLTAQMHLLTY